MKNIKIEQIRTVIQFVQTRPQFTPIKVVFLCGAEYLNQSAANALLKTLEEPPSNVYLILTASEPELLLDTLLSRCCVIEVEPNVDQPLIAQSMIEDVFLDLYNALILQEIDITTVCEKWAKLDLNDVLTSLWLILGELLKNNYQLSCNYITLDKSLDKTKMANFTKVQNLVQLWPILDLVIEARKNVLSGKQMNIQLFLDALLIKWKGSMLGAAVGW